VNRGLCTYPNAVSGMKKDGAGNYVFDGTPRKITPDPQILKKVGGDWLFFPAGKIAGKPPLTEGRRL
jgi:hypothetical protein